MRKRPLGYQRKNDPNCLKPFYKRKGFHIAIIILILYYSNIDIFKILHITNNTIEKAISDSKSNETSSQKDTDDTSYKDNIKDVYSFGENISLNNISIDTKSIDYWDGSDIDKPQKNNHFILIYLQIKNIGDKSISFKVGDFYLESKSGEKIKKALIIDKVKNSLKSKTLSNGEESYGFIAFETPKETNETYMLKYSSELIGNETLSIELKN